MSCGTCKNVVDIENHNLPHVVRKCKNCGREMHIQSPGDHGIGIKVNKGDKFVVPNSWFKIHANPFNKELR